MLYEIAEADFDKVRPLTKEQPLVLAVDAVLDGTCPGAVWADDPDVFNAAIVETPEGHYLVGDAEAGGFAPSLMKFITKTLSPGGRGENWWWFYLRCPSDAWTETMRRTLPSERAVEKPREFYVCDELTFDWRGKVPAGFELVRVDERLIARDDLENVDHLRSFAKGNFGSVEQFLNHGFAFCVIHDDTIVSECFTDNVSRGRCEVGVRTSGAYRRRGLGSLVVARTVDWALSNGLDQVGWHCLRYNLASAATARKVGFRKAEDYFAFLVCGKRADASIVKGNLCLIRHEFEEAADHYTRALDAVDAEGLSASKFLAHRGRRTSYAFQAASARALAGQRELGIELVDEAIEIAGYRVGGY